MEYTNTARSVIEESGADWDKFVAGFLAIKDGLTWHTKNDAVPVPYLQGYGIGAFLAEYGMRATAIAWDGVVVLGNFEPGIYGIETDKQRIYLLDFGDGVVPLVIETKE